MTNKTTCTTNTLVSFAEELSIENPQKQDSKNKFSGKSTAIWKQIEHFKAKHPDLNYIDCTIAICEENGIELETLRSGLPKAIKEKIEADALDLNLLKYKNNTLL